MSTSKVQQHLNPEWVRQGATVKAFREMRGMRVDELASALGITRPYLSNIEAGRKRLTPILVAKAADALGVRQIALVRPDETEAAA